MIDYGIVVNALPQLLKAAGISLAIALFASVLGFIGGTILGLIQTSKYKILNWLVTVYVTVIRGTPMLLQITFMFILLPEIGINISAFTTAVIAIGMNSSAYISQVIKSGIKSVSKGQIEAAKTLGISKLNLTLHIILPQALRVVIPALGNEFVTLIKDSSLASIIGVIELFKRGDIIISRTYDAITIYVLVGLIYLIITTILTIIIHKIEKQMNKHVRN